MPMQMGNGSNGYKPTGLPPQRGSIERQAPQRSSMEKQPENAYNMQNQQNPKMQPLYQGYPSNPPNGYYPNYNSPRESR